MKMPSSSSMTHNNTQMVMANWQPDQQTGEQILLDGHVSVLSKFQAWQAQPVLHSRCRCLRGFGLGAGVSGVLAQVRRGVLLKPAAAVAAALPPLKSVAYQPEPLS
jgi:hypothetical protein